MIKYCKRAGFCVAVFYTVNTVTAMDYESKNIISNCTTDVSNNLTGLSEDIADLQRQYNSLKERITVLRAGLLKVQKETNQLCVRRSIFQNDPKVKYEIYSAKDKIQLEENKKKKFKDDLISSILNYQGAWGPLNKIMDDNPIVKMYARNCVLDRNIELRSALFQMDDKISEAQSQKVYLENMFWLAEMEKRAEPEFEFPVDKTFTKDVYELLKENDFLIEEYQKKQAKLAEIEKRNKQLQADIYGLGMKLPKIKLDNLNIRIHH